jgi:extradiol dioxygenase family protein
MTNRYIFHLSIPVSDLQDAERFYTSVLEAQIGRRGPDWIDALVWGHQITLQLRPDEVLPLERQGKRHFGVVLPWAEWETLAERLRAEGTPFLSPPETQFAGTSGEQAKLYLEDPAHNIIEIKAYREPQKTIGAGSTSYAYPDP